MATPVQYMEPWRSLARVASWTFMADRIPSSIGATRPEEASHDERRGHSNRTAGSRHPPGQAGVRDADHRPPGGGPALLLQVPRPGRDGREQRKDPCPGHDRGRGDDAAHRLALSRL